jgi:uncharacterized membrane protein YfcA
MNLLTTNPILLFLIIGAANAVIGGLIGICGIAGFLLPMLYTGALFYSVNESLAFSFLAFFISGILGSYQYYKSGNLAIRRFLPLVTGSFAGAVLGVFLQAMIPKETAKSILYLVVLFSGISILYRMYRETKASASTKKAPAESPLLKTVWFLPLLGFTTGAICSLSGAGGPVLVMPLLITFGISARLAVGIALFDSIFIALPSCIGYLSRADLDGSLGLLVLIVLTHGIGVIIGSHFAGKVPVKGLKIFVALFSVLIAIYMLL